MAPKRKQGFSWVWNSIQYGKDLLQHGIERQIWSGKQTTIQVVNGNSTIFVKDLMCPMTQRFLIIEEMMFQLHLCPVWKVR